MAESSLSRSNIRRISPVRGEGGSASGSNIPVAGARSRYDEARATLERGLLESRRRQVLGNAPAQTPGTTPATAPASTPAAAPASTVAAAPASTVAPILARSQPAAPARQGMIDGRPAGEVLAGMRQEALQGGPTQTYGKDIANRNVEKLGVQGAIADYKERNRLDTERPQRAAAAQTEGMQPGSMNPYQTPVERNPLDFGGPASRTKAEEIGFVNSLLGSSQNPNIPYKPTPSVTPTYDLMMARGKTATNPLDFPGPASEAGAENSMIGSLQRQRDTSAPILDRPATLSRASAAAFMSQNADTIRSQQQAEKAKRDQEAASLRAQQIQRQRSIPRTSTRVM